MKRELEFKEILYNYLIENDLTQTQFAFIVNIKQSQVSEWLKGKAKPAYHMLKQIVIKTGIPADFWLGFTDEY